MGAACSSCSDESSATGAAPARVGDGARDDLWRARRETPGGAEEVAGSHRLQAGKALVYGDAGGGERAPIHGDRELARSATVAWTLSGPVRAGRLTTVTLVHPADDDYPDVIARAIDALLNGGRRWRAGAGAYHVSVREILALGPSVYRACWTDFARGLAYLGRTLVQVAISLA
jgi:hypothetical protein